MRDNAEQLERDRIQQLLDGAVQRWGDAKLNSVIHADSFTENVRQAEAIRRAERAEQERAWRARYRHEERLQAAKRAAYWERRADDEAEAASLHDDPPIRDNWRRLHETGFYIEFEKKRKRRKP